MNLKPLSLRTKPAVERRDKAHAIATELDAIRESEALVKLIMLAAITAGLAVVMVLPDRPLPALPLAMLVAAWEVRAWIDRRVARLEAELALVRERQLAHYRLHVRSGRRGPPPRLGR